LQAGGVLVVAPEHRNSMYLKHLELALTPAEEALQATAGPDSNSSPQALAMKLDGLLNEFAYWDVLDESDEVLHHQ
jgi:hypothetical protein